MNQFASGFMDFEKGGQHFNDSSETWSFIQSAVQ